MQPVINNFFIRPQHKQNQQSSSSVKGNHQRFQTSISSSQSVSYLMYNKPSKVKRKENSQSKRLQSIETLQQTQKFKTEEQEKKETILPERNVLIKSKKSLRLREMTEQIYNQDPEIEQQQVENQLEEKSKQEQTQGLTTLETEAQIQHTVEDKKQQEIKQQTNNQVIGESIKFKASPKTKQKKQNLMNDQATNLNESEKFVEKSTQILRKVIQLINSNRDRLIMEALNSPQSNKKWDSSKNEFEREMSGFRMSTIGNDRSPSGRDKFFPQISIIHKKQTKMSNQTTNYANFTESLKPMKSLIDAIKEKESQSQTQTLKQEEKGQQQLLQKEDSMADNIQKKKVRLCVTGVDLNDSQQMEFDYPNYMEPDQSKRDSSKLSTLFDQSQLDQKEQKSQNIYSLVTKSLLQKQNNSRVRQFASKFVSKFGQKILTKKQESDSLEDYQSIKVLQYTRYYLQNKIIKILSKSYNSKNQGEEKSQIIIFKQDSTTNDLNNAVILPFVNTIGTLKSEYSANKQFQAIFLDIGQPFYKTQDLNIIEANLEVSLSEDDQSQLSMDIQRSKFHYIINNFKIDLYKIIENELRPIVNYIDDESKNFLLHYEILDYEGSKIESYKYLVSSDDEEKHEVPLISYLTELTSFMNRKDKRKLLKCYYEAFDTILLGEFQDSISKHLTKTQSAYIAGLQQTNKSIIEQKQKDVINETIPKDNLKSSIILSVHPPPQKCKSDSGSNSNISETKTKKSGRQKSERLLMIKPQKSTRNIISQNNLSTVKENGEQQQKQQYQQQQQQQQQNNVLQKELSQKQSTMKSSRKLTESKDYRNYSRQQSMDPFSLLFRTMLITQDQDRDRSNIQLLFRLIEQHKILDMKEMISHDTNISMNVADDDGNTLLIYAAKVGSPQIISYLLQNGADIHHKNNEGKTALQIALENFQFQAADVINSFTKSHDESHSLLY